MSRWDSLPANTQEQDSISIELTTPSTEYIVRNTINALIRQEISDSGQNICYYQRIGNGVPIPYICNLGCCSRGCCTVANLAATSNSLGWAVGLLCLVIMAVILAIIAVGAVYYMNKQKDRVHKQQLSERSDGSSVSQISCYRDGY